MYHAGDQPPKSFGPHRNGSRLGLLWGIVLVVLSVLQPFPNGLAGDNATTINFIIATLGTLLIILSLASSLVRDRGTPSRRRRLSRRAEEELGTVNYKHREAVRILYAVVTEND